MSISQSCVSSGSSMMGLMSTSSKRAYAKPKSAASRTPAPAAGHCRTIPPQETLKHGSGYLCGVSGSWCTQGLLEPSEHLWWNRGLILNANSPLLPSCWGFSDLGRGVSPLCRLPLQATQTPLATPAPPNSHNNLINHCCYNYSHS